MSIRAVVKRGLVTGRRARPARLRDLRPAAQRRALGVHRALVLSAQAAAGVRPVVSGSACSGRRAMRWNCSARASRSRCSRWRSASRSRSRRATRWPAAALPLRALILLAFLLPQAFPSLAVYINVARIFYSFARNGMHRRRGARCTPRTAWCSRSGSRRRRSPRSTAKSRTPPAAWAPSPLHAFFTVTLPLAPSGIMASAIFVFLESLDEFTGTYFVGVPEVHHPPAPAVHRQLWRATTRSPRSPPSRGGAVGRLHAGDRALPQGRRAGEGGELKGARGTLSRSRGSAALRPGGSGAARGRSTCPVDDLQQLLPGCLAVDDRHRLEHEHALEHLGRPSAE